jgi:hypothetical protein
MHNNVRHKTNSQPVEHLILPVTILAPVPVTGQLLAERLLRARTNIHFPTAINIHLVYHSIQPYTSPFTI